MLMSKLDRIDNLPDYLHAFRQEITDRVQGEAPPAHDPTRDGTDPRLDGAIRRPYPVQAHAITAITKVLEDRPGIYVCGEMGTGKTLIAALASWLIFPHGRTLIMSPGHLVLKWKREIEITIPDAEVWIIQNLADAARAITEPRTGKPQFWVMSKETGKLSYSRRPQARTLAGETARGNVVVQQKKADTQQGITKTIYVDGKQITVTTVDVYCPDCAARLERPGATAEDLPKRLQLADLKKKDLHCPTCNLEYFDRQEAEPYWNIPAEIAKKLRPEEITAYKKRTRQRYTPMNGADNQRTRKVAIADYFSRKNARFDLFIADECHELKGSDTAQGNALGTLASCASKVLCLTGTLIGGHASHLFYLNYRMDPQGMKRGGFTYGKTDLWVDRYGVRETVIREITEAAGRNTNSRGTRTGSKTAHEEKPGISPALFAEQLLNSAVFLHLEDVAAELPPITETPVPVDMDADLAVAYRNLEQDIRRVMNEQLARGNRKLLGRFLVNLLSYPDKPFDNQPVDLANGTYAVPKELPQDLEYSKESELIEIVRDARRRGRKSLIYLTFTGKRDTSPRIQKLLTQYGISSAILYSKDVDPKNRERWIEERAPMIDALIVNPECVKTGLDLIQFPTVIYLQTGYSIFTLRQSSRRSWRIGQTEPVEIYYLYYKETMQARAMKLISKKLAASTALEGKLTSEGLQALAGDDEDEAMQLARALCENEEIEGIETAWKALNQQHAEQQEKTDMRKKDSLLPAGMVKGRTDIKPEITAEQQQDPLAVIGTTEAPDMKNLCETYEEGQPPFAKGLDKISHDLMPAWLKRHMPKLYSQEKNPDPLVMVKWFTPDSSWTWYVTEYSDKAPDGTPRLAFGLVDGHEAELGYISLDEIESATGPMGLRVERDLWWRPTPLSEVRKMVDRGRYPDPAPDPTPPPAEYLEDPEAEQTEDDEPIINNYIPEEREEYISNTREPVEPPRALDPSNWYQVMNRKFASPCSFCQKPIEPNAETWRIRHQGIEPNLHTNCVFPYQKQLARELYLDEPDQATTDPTETRFDKKEAFIVPTRAGVVAIPKDPETEKPLELPTVPDTDADPEMLATARKIGELAQAVEDLAETMPDAARPQADPLPPAVKEILDETPNAAHFLAGTLNMWERAKAGEEVFCNHQALDILAAKFKDDPGEDAHLFFQRFITRPNPQRLGTLDQFIGHIQQEAPRKTTEEPTSTPPTPGVQKPNSPKQRRSTPKPETIYQPNNTNPAETTQGPPESKTDTLKPMSAQEANIRRLCGRDPNTNAKLPGTLKNVIPFDPNRRKNKPKPIDTRQISLFG